MTRYWVISDTHFGHSNILKHCRRPADADVRIIKNWQRLVAPDDIVYHLGDFAFTAGRSHNLEHWFVQLPGRIVLVRGNHDAYSLSRYTTAGASACVDALVAHGVLMTHKPQAWLPDGVRFNAHGHLHNNVPEGYHAYPHCRLFALEYEDYGPRLLEKWLHAS